MNDFYQYLGKSKINIDPLAEYLKSSIIPLYEDKTYRNWICSLRTKESIAHGYPPVFLDNEWKPEKGKIAFSKNFWCLPFKYTDDHAMFVVGGINFLKMFPEVFELSNVDPWYTTLKNFLDKPQIIITNGDSSLHSDVGGRSCALNTFLYNTDKSKTELWNKTEKVHEIVYNPGDAYLLNVRQRHQIKQTSNETRCVLSWGYSIPFQKAIEILNEKSKQ